MSVSASTFFATQFRKIFKSEKYKELVGGKMLRGAMSPELLQEMDDKTLWGVGCIAYQYDDRLIPRAIMDKNYTALLEAVETMDKETTGGAVPLPFPTAERFDEVTDEQRQWFWTMLGELMAFIETVQKKVEAKIKSDNASIKQ